MNSGVLSALPVVCRTGSPSMSGKRTPMKSPSQRENGYRVRAGMNGNNAGRSGLLVIYENREPSILVDMDTNGRIQIRTGVGLFDLEDHRFDIKVVGLAIKDIASKLGPAFVRKAEDSLVHAR